MGFFPVTVGPPGVRAGRRAQRKARSAQRRLRGWRPEGPADVAAVPATAARRSGAAGASPPAAAAPAAHRFHVLPSMAGFLDAAFAAFDRARRRLLVETYIVKDDALGQALAARLAAAAARGVDVRLLYDPSGSNEAPARFFAALREAGVDVRPWGRGACLGALRPGIRTHSRIVVADDVAFTGGHAWAREWLPRAQGGDGWCEACCRLEGPVVGDFVALFERRWREARTGSAADFDTGARHPGVRLLSDGPRGRSLILDAYLDAIAGARRRVWLANAYFFPAIALVEALFAAAARGVDVRIVVPAKSDIPIIGRAARAEYGLWLERGLALFEYGDAVMHAKYGVVDDDWALVGTYNANAFGARLAVETAVVVSDPRFVAKVAARYERDLARCDRVDAAAVEGRSFWTRELDACAHAAMSVVDLALWPRGGRRIAAAGPAPASEPASEPASAPSRLAPLVPACPAGGTVR